MIGNRMAAAAVGRGMDHLNPPNRPRRGVIAIGAAAAVAALATAMVVASPPTAVAASGLETFESCDDVQAWGRLSIRRAERGNGRWDDDIVTDQSGLGAESMPTAGTDSGPAGAPQPGGEGGTNVVVTGVDELDEVERLGDDLALVVSNQRLAIVDLDGGEVQVGMDVTVGSQITYDAGAGIAWVVGPGSYALGDSGAFPSPEVSGAADDVAVPYVENVSVQRVAVGERSLSVEAEWTTSGTLLDARRVGDRLHLVATEGFASTTGGEDLPFEDGPVACDDVLHPVGSSNPTATLLVTLPVTGALEPTHAAEVVGAGELVHVTTDAAYLATPMVDGAEGTAIHRFELGSLTHTGSGRVQGSLLDEFSMSEHEGHLRVAVTVDSSVPLPLDDLPAVDADSIDVIEPDAPSTGEALNQVVVLDTEGDLDVVGRTERFGHPGETLHGIRFTGDVAYAVTFLQTDPFYVVDLTDPRSPRVAGEVELPGFSAYLHPISATLVAGFGPGEDGRATVKLFDVSDAASPMVLDTIVLGDESAVVDDHHAFVDLGDGRFAVPTSTHTQEFPIECTEELRDDAQADRSRLQAEIDQIYVDYEDVDPDGANARANEVYAEIDEIAAEGCLYPASVPESDVVVVDTSEGWLDEVERHTVRLGEAATRVLPSDAGWGLLGGDRIVLLDPSGAERATLDLT